jgi:two-component system capsular synthesis response regulator RcsB
MINKVLIAEDHESANISVRKILEEMEIKDIDYAYYCDDALQKIRYAQQLKWPYDLLITDLYFEADGRDQVIEDGRELIAAARQEQPGLRILVFSAESKPDIIERLFEHHQIDGYVRKARHDVRELKLAFESISQNQRYLPRHLSQLFRQKNSHEFTEFDIAVISLLAQGVRQNRIPEQLQQMKIRPNGLSTIEKRLAHIRQVLQCNNNEQLIAFCKDMGII